MDQTTEQTAQPDVTQTTTTLTAEQPTTETTATLTTPEAPAVDFQSLIPEEYREEKSLQNFNKMDDFVKSYLHSQKLVGLDKIAVPNKHATDEDWKQVYKKLGSPETAEAYKYSLPEGHAVPEDTLKSFSEEAVKLGLLPNQADGIMKYYNEVINQGVNDQNIKAEEARKVELAKARVSGFVDAIINKEALLGKVDDENKEERMKELNAWDEIKLEGFSMAIESMSVPEDSERTFGKGKAVEAEAKPEEIDAPETSRMFAMKDGRIVFNGMEEENKEE